MKFVKSFNGTNVRLQVTPTVQVSIGYGRFHYCDDETVEVAIIGRDGWYVLGANGRIRRVPHAQEVIPHFPVADLPLLLKKAARIVEMVSP